jgi:hypothetical protein
VSPATREFLDQLTGDPSAVDDYLTATPHHGAPRVPPDTDAARQGHPRTAPDPHQPQSGVTRTHRIQKRIQNIAQVLAHAVNIPDELREAARNVTVCAHTVLTRHRAQGQP